MNFKQEYERFEKRNSEIERICEEMVAEFARLDEAYPRQTDLN